jgi:hypothetical protein
MPCFWRDFVCLFVSFVDFTFLTRAPTKCRQCRRSTEVFLFARVFCLLCFVFVLFCLTLCDRSWLLGNAFVFGDDVELLMGTNPTATTTASSSATSSSTNANSGCVFYFFTALRFVFSGIFVLFRRHSVVFVDDDARRHDVRKRSVFAVGNLVSFFRKREICAVTARATRRKASSTGFCFCFCFRFCFVLFCFFAESHNTLAIKQQSQSSTRSLSCRSIATSMRWRRSPARLARPNSYASCSFSVLSCLHNDLLDMLIRSCVLLHVWRARMCRLRQTMLRALGPDYVGDFRLDGLCFCEFRFFLHPFASTLNLCFSVVFVLATRLPAIESDMHSRQNGIIAFENFAVSLLKRVR